MQNSDLWSPSKFIRTGNTWMAARDAVPAGSHFVADILARVYTDALRGHARGRLLDLGCGTVPLYEAYRDLVSEAVCIDRPGVGTPNPFLDLEHDLEQPIPLSDASFDTILATDVLEHIARPADLLAEVARLLRPDGHLIIGVPFLYRLHEEPRDFYRYTEHGLRFLVETKGLEVFSLEPYGGSPEVLLDLAGKHILRVFPSWAGLVRRGSHALMRTPPFPRVSRATARGFPLGYVLVARRA